MLRSDTSLSSAAITDSIDRALMCLRRNFRAVGDAEAGWYHYLDDQRPGVTASAVGLYCFRLASLQFERTDEVLRFLITQQSTGPDDQAGGWAVRTTHGFPIVEATAWVVRAMSRPGTRLPLAGASLQKGAAWLERNQNTDFGWGSYYGQTSRVFTTALTMLALEQCGGSESVIGNGQKWLIDAESQGQAAWGVLPGGEPTMLHTSCGLLALLNLRGALTASGVRQCAEWLLEKLEPGVHVEETTTVEEYDIPYPSPGGSELVFQNSLPHFAGPIAITAILNSGVDPLQPKLFDAIKGILDTQLDDGCWKLPRSPLRASIWAIMPFVAALTAFRTAMFPTRDSRASLLFPGCAIVQSADAKRQLTRRLLIRNALFDWFKQRRIAVALWSIAALTVLIPLGLLLAGEMAMKDFLVALILPALLLIFQLIFTRRGSPGSVG